MKLSLIKKGIMLAAAMAGLFANVINSQDLATALKLTNSEQYDKAEAMLQQLIQKEPGNSKYYFYLGESTLLDYFADTISNSLTLVSKTAHDIYQKGVEANASDPLNYVGLAKVAFYLGDDKKAVEMRTKAKSLLLPYKNIKKMVPPARDYAFALAKIAESYIREKEVDTSAALPLIRQAQKIDNKNPDIFLIAGDIYILANDGSNAIKNYNLAQFLNPNSPTANMKIGNIYVRGKNLQAAIPYFEEAINLDASYAPAYRELGQLYWMAQRLEQSKANFKKYLELTEGNIPAQTRYVNSLFYAGDYDEVIKNVEEILAVDKSRAYMNRLAGYSCYEKNPPDYEKALYYMEELFKNVAPERIIPKDHHYMARILIKKNANATLIADEAISLRAQVEKEKARLAATKVAADKAKIQANIKDLTGRADNLEKQARAAAAEVDRGFAEYGKLLATKPDNRALLGEIAAAYNLFRNYYGVAKTLSKMLGPLPEKREDYMQVGRAYYNAERYQAADSIFNIIIKSSPDYVPAYLWIARTFSKMDPDSKLGLAKSKFDKVLKVAETDSVKHSSEMAEALGYLGYYHMINSNFSLSKDYYNRLISLEPKNDDYKIRGYNGIGLVELRLASNEKTNEGRLPYLARSADAYNKILALDPNNISAKNQISYIREFEAQVRKGINPNEIKGVIKDAATGTVIPYASIRVKDTAAENLTNSKGEYKFEIPQGSEVLIISAKGYKTQEVTITKSRIYNVSLSK